jgi:hypothetical protein
MAVRFNDFGSADREFPDSNSKAVFDRSKAVFGLHLSIEMVHWYNYRFIALSSHAA